VATALIICIGNDLVADDGAGKAVHAGLAAGSLAAGTRLVFLGLGGIDLLEEMNGEDLLVVVDAVQLGAAPGFVHVLDWEAIPAQGPRPVSGHGIGIREAIEIGRRLYPEKIPHNIYLIGIEGKCFNQLGQWMSPQVVAAVPRAVEQVLRLLP